MLERDLFISAWDIDDPIGRRAYLDSVCANNAALRNRLERLLSHACEDSDFLNQPAAYLCSNRDSAWLADASELPQTQNEPVTETGAAGDTGQTVMLDPAVPGASVATTMALSPGPLGTLFGRYRLERMLGAGGMGTVFLAEDMRLGRRVALKIPNFDVDGKLHLIERFRREARTMASVLHRHLCPIFDVDEQDGQYYLTMAFIDGETLAQALQQGLTFSARQIADLVRKLALALDAAHRAGIIHRDLKPANVMIDREGEPIVMDFGLAWMVHETDARVTQSGAIIGTPAYMSPEQAKGDPDEIGTASDIYSLGAILYELLAGRPIHTGSVRHVLSQLQCDQPTRPSVIRRNVDPQLEAICWKAIARQPEDRYASAGEFAQALSAWREGEASAEPRVPTPYTLTAESPKELTPIAAEKGQNAVPRRRWRTATVGFAALVLMAVVLLITTRNGTVVVTSPDGKLPADIQVVVTRGGEETVVLQADNLWSAKLVNGEYQVQLRGGEDRFEITNSQLTIHRLGRAMVRLQTRPPVALPQPDPIPATPTTPSRPPAESAKPVQPVDVSKPFVVVREGRALRSFRTLSAAINELQLGDIIEICSNERLFIQLSEPVVKPLVIRAQAGYRPWLEFAGQGRCEMHADFSVEGCDLDLRSAPFTVVDQKDLRWRFHRCRLWGDPGKNFAKIQFSECLLTSIFGIDAPENGTVTDYEFDNCLIRCGNLLIRYAGSSSHTLRLRNCTFYAVAGGHPRLAHLRGNPNLTVQATGNVFHCQSQAGQLIEAQSLPQVTWIGADNCFSGTWYQIWEGNVIKEKGLPAWNKLWKAPEQNSREVDFLAFEWGRIQRLANPERSNAVRAATEKMIAEYKLPEVGPDWNLVGPGVAYFRALAAEGRAVTESQLRPERREDGPVVLLRDGKEVGGYLTIKQALDTAEDKDVVELRTDGLIPSTSWSGVARLLTIRAGAGYTPTIDGLLESTGTDRLILEGLTIRHVLQASGGAMRGEAPLFPSQGSIARMMNCTLLPETNKSVCDAWLFGDGDSIPEIVNCVLGHLRIGLRSGGTARLRNSLLAECRPNVESQTAEPGRLEVERCTFWIPEPAFNLWSASVQSLSPMTIQARRSLFVTPGNLTFGHPQPIHWTGTGNVFVKPLGFQFGKEALQLKQFQTEFQTEADSIELPPWEFDPAQWRILRDKSPGYQPRPDGTDYGANVERLIDAIKPTGDRLPADAPRLAIAPFTADEARAHQAAWAKHLDLPVEYENSIGMKFVLIPPGEFTMGSTPAEIEAALLEVGDTPDWRACIESEAPQHKVVLKKPFYLGVHEVTQGEYEQVMGRESNRSAFAPRGLGRSIVEGMETAKHPVEMVNWSDAVEFCAKLSQLKEAKLSALPAAATARVPDEQGYRLPTEAEWEFACRAGTTTKYWCGDITAELLRTAWFDRNSAARTHAVGEFPANPFGMRDMHGNVWEWVWDVWQLHDYERYRDQPAIDPTGGPPGDWHHVLRGGHWRSTALICRASARFASLPGVQPQNCAGFRAALNVEAVRASLANRTP